MNSSTELERKLKREHIVLVVVVLLILGTMGYRIFWRTPPGFKSETVVSVTAGESVSVIAKHLQEQHLINSPFWFTNLIILRHGESKITAGDYIFHEPESLFSVAKRFTTADFQMTPIKTTIPEGSSIYDIAEIMSNKFATFDPVVFLDKAKDEEGYLFPDTYFLFATVKPEALITTLKNNFAQKIEPLKVEITQSGRTLHDVLVLASLLEGEVKSTADRKIVAGIFLRRMAIGMKLQSDATFRYINGKTSAQLTATDLKIDSPYNTYRYPGLPPTPISNPGLDTISAALHPTETKYFYFLTDSKGEVHYAVTYAQHLKNVKKYIK